MRNVVGSVVAAAAGLALCGLAALGFRTSSPVEHGTPRGDLEACRQSDTYLAKLVDALGPHSVEGWVDRTLSRRIPQSEQDWAMFGGTAAVIDGLLEGRAPTVAWEEVCGSLVASDVVVVSDVHSCMLHEAAVFALVATVESTVGARPILGFETLRSESVREDGSLVPDGQAFVRAARSECIRERGIVAWSARGAFILPLYATTYAARMQAAAAAVPGRPLDFTTIGMEDAVAVNAIAVEAIVRARRRKPGARTWIQFGVAHVHSTDGGLPLLLRSRGFRCTVVHPYDSYALGVKGVSEKLFSGRWVRVRPQEYMAPLPSELAPIMGYHSR